MNITIKEKSGAKQELHVSKAHEHDMRHVECRYYTPGGHYNACYSWSDLIDVDDIERQLYQSSKHYGAEVYQVTYNGRIIPLQAIVL